MSPPRNVFTSLTPSVVHLDRYCQVSFDSRTDKGNCPVRREKSGTRHHKSRTIFSLSLHTFALRPSTIPFHATSAFPMDEPDVRDLPVRNECTTEAQVSVIAVSSANYAWFLRVPWEGAIAEYIHPLSPPLPLCHFVEAIRMPGVPGINEGRRAKTCARPSCTSCSTSLIHIRPLLSSCISLLPPGSQATPSTTATVQRYGHKEFLFGHIRIRRWHTSYWHVDGLATMSFFGLFKFLVELACRPTTTSSR